MAKRRRSKRDYTGSVKHLFKRKRTVGKGRKKKLRKVLRLAAAYRRRGIANPLKAAWAKAKGKNYSKLNYKSKHKRKAVIDKDLGI